MNTISNGTTWVFKNYYTNGQFLSNHNVNNKTVLKSSILVYADGNENSCFSLLNEKQFHKLI